HKKSGKAREGFPRGYSWTNLTLRSNLEDELQSEFDVAAAAVEVELVQERRPGSNEDVARVQGIGVAVLIDRTVVGWQADAEVAMVEGVIGRSAELQREALVDFGRFEEAHVPDVESGSADGIAANVGDGADFRLDKARRRINCEIAHDV